MFAELMGIKNPHQMIEEYAEALIRADPRQSNISARLIGEPVRVTDSLVCQVYGLVATISEIEDRAPLSPPHKFLTSVEHEKFGSLEGPKTSSDLLFFRMVDGDGNLMLIKSTAIQAAAEGMLPWASHDVTLNEYQFHDIPSVAGTLGTIPVALTHQRGAGFIDGRKRNALHLTIVCLQLQPMSAKQVMAELCAADRETLFETTASVLRSLLRQPLVSTVPAEIWQTCNSLASASELFRFKKPMISAASLGYPSGTPLTDALAMTMSLSVKRLNPIIPVCICGQCTADK